MRARQANLADTSAVGALVSASFDESPSSLFGPEDFPADPLEIGVEVLERPLASGGLVWVVEAGDQLAGVAIARQRPLRRARHVADLTLLIHPLARRRGAGGVLLRAIEDAARASLGIHKLAIRVTCDDDALKATLRASSSPWAYERVEREGLRRGASFVDIEQWGLVLGAGPVPGDFQGT